MKNPFNRATLEEIVRLLPDSPAELIRRDKNFEKLGLDAEDYGSADSVIDLLLEHPALMQRPIFAVGERAVICRPSERVLELL
jgi:arsenate reductase